MAEKEKKSLTVKITGVLPSINVIETSDYKDFDSLVKEYINKTGGVLTKIIINEKEVPMKFYDEIKTSFFEGGEVIELEFSDRNYVLMNLFESGKDYINKIKQNLDSVSRQALLDSQQSHEMLQAVAEGFQAMINIIMIAENQMFFGKAIHTPEQLDKIKKVVSQIVSSQEKKDSVDLSDIIDFDLPQTLETFKEIFENAEKEMKKEKSN
ncbi:MAG TPA: hypothetical protein PKH64_08650 [Petrotogaceae bacterium]|jgi:hypothetical protein|nr:hypothetical protein [Petrotogaceae bacterium]HNV06173.1 hypothetical protein [Petrotogaceae bacterium]HNY37360.1 hypothetical protein [Petrotogaceae bacterium]HOG34199.1 hypothetical protein [Petrotogaceae bacterium]HPG48196.1 hypothetical protein [Petrotogaceae bacterium]